MIACCPPGDTSLTKAEFIDLRTLWEAALKTAGIADFHGHGLRHTAAGYLALSGVSLVEIAKVPGHRTIRRTARQDQP